MTDAIWPGADVRGGGAAPEFLAGVRWKADQPVERTARAVLVVDVVTPQGQPERRAEVVRDPPAERPPLRVLRGIGEGGVRLLRAVVALDPHGRLPELAPQQAFHTVAIGGVVPSLLGA